LQTIKGRKAPVPWTTDAEELFNMPDTKRHFACGSEYKDARLEEDSTYSTDSDMPGPATSKPNLAAEQAEDLALMKCLPYKVFGQSR